MFYKTGRPDSVPKVWRCCTACKQ